MVFSLLFVLLFLAFLRIRHSIFSIENATSAFPMTVSLHGAWMLSSSPWVFWGGNLWDRFLFLFFSFKWNWFTFSSYVTKRYLHYNIFRKIVVLLVLVYEIARTWYWCYLNSLAVAISLNSKPQWATWVQNEMIHL